ncbi:MAG: DEAD/DEAH box helicase [Anaerolineae bacterium]|nr:DEAD/DEAH box helicase [Anaerolineae bacterium]
MRDTLVAVDLETTGLDPAYDRIIEIAAVKFHDDKIIDEWQTFVDPKCPIPQNISQITGIFDADVADAPSIRTVLPKLEQFIGHHPVIGHNISFDAAFIRSAGLNLANPLLDTYSLASVMMPSAARYSLFSLSSHLDIDTEGAHRALNDVHMTIALYRELWARILTLPLETLAEIARHSRNMHWDGALAFEAAMEERYKENPSAGEASSGGFALVFEEAEAGYKRLRPADSPQRLDADQLAALLEPEGLFDRSFDAYEYRPQQVEMLKQVARAFSDGRHLLIEAPTGVGKSIAYLVPAIKYAVENDDRVVISTNTINLQEQLDQKDIPMLMELLDLPFRAAILKGRGNYLCPRRLAVLRRRGPTSPAEMHMLAKLLVWMLEVRTGNRSDITLRGPAESSVWRRLSAEDEGCTAERCSIQMLGTCPFFHARQQAEAAHILIVNHSLLLSDIATEGRVLPDYRHLIIDEAHQLEGAVTNSLSFRTDPDHIARLIADLGTGKTGLLGELLSQTRDVIPAGYYQTLHDYVDVIVNAASTMNVHVDRFFSTLWNFIENHVAIRRNEYTQQIRLINAMRHQPAWADVEIAWDNLSKFTDTIAYAMQKLVQGLSELQEFDIPDFEDTIAGASATARRLTELHLRLHELVAEPDGNTVYWAAIRPDGGQMSVQAAPLDVGPLVRDHLWMKKETLVMTSATMRTEGNFAYIRERLAAEDADEVVIDSPFDYKSNTLLYLVNDIPEPTDKNAYQKAVENGLIELCRATQGQTMVLFTSYAQLRATANAIGEPLSRDGIAIYDQSAGSSRSQLLEGFVHSEKAVLMGTRSFWEGVDVPGTDLSILVIVRLPFSVPSEPIFAARSELFDDPFHQYALPETILRFRQGFGRLIRRKDDRGVVAIFDRRILSKRYGAMILDSLPRCTVLRKSMASLPEAAVRWLELKE